LQYGNKLGNKEGRLEMAVNREESGGEGLR
jgi:hypothetical protein